MALWTVGSIGQLLEDCSAVIAPKPLSGYGGDALVDWLQWSGVPTLARGPAAVRIARTTYRRVAEQTREAYIPSGAAESRAERKAAHPTGRGSVDHRHHRLETTEKTLAKAAFEDTTQEHLVCQTQVADFDVHTNKSLSEELEALAKAKVVITEAQLTFHVASTMHAEKGETEESEPPCRTARGGDIVMVIDGER